MPKLILTFLLMSLLATSAAAVELVGYCFLEDQSTFAGTMVVFTGFEIWFVTDTAYTDVNGFFRIVLPPDAYDVHYTHPGYLDWWETASAFTGIVVLPTVNLQPLPGTPLGGALSGTLSNDSSYIVAHSIWIEAEDTLIIEPGTEIFFADSATFAIFGTLWAVGSPAWPPEDSIRFLPLPTQFPTFWGGIRFYDTASDCCRLDYCVIRGGANTSDGGIYIEEANVHISNCSICNNPESWSASWNAGIYVIDGSPHVVNCSVVGNSAHYGAGMCCYNSNPVITHCVFDGNQGGGMYLENSHPEISDCDFVANSSSSGGGIRCAGSNPSISNCVFYDNNAFLGCGGGVSLFASSPVITDCFLYGNSAGLGGGIYCFYNSNATITDCEIIENSAAELGGGIYVNESHPSLSNCFIEANNTNNGYGGGLWLDDADSTSIANCSFEGNTAHRGGGMAAQFTQFSILDCSFEANEATKGGAIFSQNQSSITLSNSQFGANSSSEQGGGVFLDFSSSVIASGCTFNQNMSQTNGGGISCEGQGELDLTGCIFQGNSAGLDGGSLYCEFSAFTLTDCEFVDNSAGISGGAVFDSSYISVGRHVTRCLFHGNSAGNKGGGLALVGGSTTVDHCTITRNECAASGGGVYLLYPTVTHVSNTIIENNTNAGIYVSNPSYYDSTFIRYCDFCSNDSGDYIFFPTVAAPVGLGELDTVNLNGDSCDVYANIFLDPLFTNPGNGLFTLQTNSPCIDAGDPLSPLDPDSTIADIGAFPFYQALAVENQPFDVPPEAFCLYPVYPNPFNAEAILRFDLPQAGYVCLSVFDITGREVRRIEEDLFNPGSYHYTFDGSALASGLYFVRLQAQEFVAVQKVTLVK